MAAVAVPPSPQVIDAMANRRVPLANLQNATNSPLRATAAGGKRQRSHASEQRDLLYGQPPAKKPMVEVDDAESRRSGLLRRSGAPITALTRRLEAARDEKSQKPALKPVDRTQRAANENLDQIRQWQRHYRTQFPRFVFYFESIPEDIKYRIWKQAYALGSREAKFFSREVTHVITARPIPADIDSSSSSTAKGTVNPAQLESKRSVFDTALQKNNNHGDILYKAKDLGMKIWPVDKLQRMIDAMFNTATGEETPHHGTRPAAAVPQARGRQADLQKLLENEKLNDRDYSVASQDLIPLRGYYIYVHDMDEATRPVMVREYSKVTKKEDGKWPQFRISGTGKCPFVEDRDHARRQQQEEQEAQRARKATAAAVPRTRAATAMEEKRALGEINNLARRPSAPTLSTKAEGDKPLEASNMVPPKRANTDGMPPMFGSAQASLRAMPRVIGGEPIASGLQQSNITSAIRSQMISSTSAAPGARAGQSKEVNQLKRKVLEKNVPSANTNSGHSSVMNDMRAALNGDFAQPTRAAKRKAQETLGYIREDSIEAERQARKAPVIRRRRTVEKELKPGYCENCREKFNDFDEHVLSRKHRKFAVAADNWQELDQLLAQLSRE